MDSLQLSALDLMAFAGYVLGLLFIGYAAGRNRRTGTAEYFLAGRSLPWYAVGGSYVATNISSEHFIGMLGAAYIYGICISLNEWRSVWSLSLLVWLLIPFLLASRSFTIPEFLEKRFNAFLRHLFAVVTVACNITVFLAAVLYGGGLATHPWPFMVVGFLSVSLWFHVLNQTMIQRVFAARDMYHARMGILFAGYLKAFMPVLVIFPGLIFFARDPDILLLPWSEVRAEADKAYIRLVQELVPIGLRGLLLAAFFGAVQSTINSVLNSTATVVTLDLYRGLINPRADDRALVRVGVWVSALVLGVSVALAILLVYWRDSIFVYMQTLIAFFAPPFAAVFLVGLLWKRINSAGAVAAVLAGFGLGVFLKVYSDSEAFPAFLRPYDNQGILIWVFSLLVCIGVSLGTAPPPPEKVGAATTLQWGRTALLQDLDGARYKRVVFCWVLYVGLIIGLVAFFSGWGD